jgi:hypothetical protein
MKLRTLARALLRRWYAVIAGLVALGGLCYSVYNVVPADFKTTGGIVLLPSSETMGKGSNPYLYLTGLGQAMDVLTRRMSAPDVEAQFTDNHPDASYTIAADVTSGSSILVITVKSRTSADATATMEAIVKAVPHELSAMQEDLKVPAYSRISSMPVAEPTKPTVEGKARLQATAAAGAAGFLAVVALTALLDGLLLRRSRRRAARGATSVRASRTVSGPLHSTEISSDERVDRETSLDDRSRVLVPASVADAGPVIEDRAATQTAPRRRKHQVSGERR